MVLFSSSEGLKMAEQKRDLLLELVQKTSTDEINHLIEWLFEDDEEEDND